MRQKFEVLAVLGVLVLLGYAIFISFGEMQRITGFAVEGEEINSATVSESLGYLARNSLIKDFLAEGSSICIIVKVSENTSFSYSVSKSGGEILVAISENYYCSGRDSEDFILSFVSVDALNEFVEDSSFENIKQGRAGVNYFVLPSKYIEEGGNVLCVDEFKQKYCDGLRKYVGLTGFILSDLTCCITETLTKEQEVQLTQHYDDPDYKEEPVDEQIFAEKYDLPFEETLQDVAPESDSQQEKPIVVETPGQFMGLPNVLWIIIGAVVVTAILVALIMFFHAKHVVNPVEHDKNMTAIQTWIHEAANHGYTEEQVREALKEQGWTKSDVDKAFYNINNPKAKL